MKRISYAGSVFVTGDEVARALLEFAASLADSGRSEVMAVPARDDSGRDVVVDVVLGPGSQLTAIPSPAASELVDEGFLEAVAERTARLTSRHPAAGGLDPYFDL